MAGKNIANPMGSVLTAAMMLDHLGLKEPAHAIESAVSACVAADLTTADVGGKLGTKEVSEEIIRRL